MVGRTGTGHFRVGIPPFSAGLQTNLASGSGPDAAAGNASWTGAALVMLRAAFWPKSPKWLNVGLYFMLGGCVVPYWSEIRDALTTQELTFLLTGAVVYVLGAFAYATKKPDPFPTVFGYHEIFHACTIIAAVLHGGMIFTMIHAST